MVTVADFARPARAGRDAWRRFARGLADFMPKGLYARSIIIVVTPVVLLQSVVAFVFMERHWETVTGRLSAAVTQSIAAIIDVYETYPQDENREQLTRIAADRLGLAISFLPPDPLPAPAPKPFFSLLDRTLSSEIRRQIQRPFWIDTIGNSSLVEIRIKLKDSVLRVIARRSQTYASNSHIFIVWMVGTSFVLLVVALMFLRNQIRPILALADAAEGLGRGRDAPDFRPCGAREVRRAAQAFIDMRRRIERQIEQRTTMLAGISHDLRTVLTRFKLQLALIGDAQEVDAMVGDVDGMQHMLDEYLAFARGDAGEQPEQIDIVALLEVLKADAELAGHSATVDFEGEHNVVLRPNAIKRCLGNLVDNACSFGEIVSIDGRHGDGRLAIIVDDDGPGLSEDQYEMVFKPFQRLDDARNQDRGGTGLGLAIARDIARSHGGDIVLSASPMGGLRASVSLPV